MKVNISNIYQMEIKTFKYKPRVIAWSHDGFIKGTL